MPREYRYIPCSHTTRAGRACRAWAAAGTDPPACSAHAGRNVGAGGTLANQNARTHGFYGRTLSERELADLVAYAADMSLDDEIACVRVALRRTLDFIRDAPGQLDESSYLNAISLIFRGARTVALLLSYRQALAAGTGDAFLKIIHHALDEINEKWEIEL